MSKLLKIMTSVFVIVSVFSSCSTKRISHRHFAKQKIKPSRNKQKYTEKKYLHPTMRPYVVRGVKYYPTVVNVGDEFRGVASWYGPNFHGKLTSSGEVYNMYGFTAAHKTLPMNTLVKVTNLNNSKSVVVRINDRGPFEKGRIIDLSKAAAKKINLIGSGTAPVKLKVLGFKNSSKEISAKTEIKGNFALQIASFTNINGAIKTQEKYDGTDGYSTIIKDVEVGGKRVFKVWLRGFKSDAEARDYKANSQFHDAFIVRED